MFSVKWLLGIQDRILKRKKRLKKQEAQKVEFRKTLETAYYCGDQMF